MSTTTRKSAGALLRGRVHAVDPSRLSPGWGAISEWYSDLAEERTGRLDIRAVVAPGAAGDAPGSYHPATGRILIDGALLGRDPLDLDPVADRPALAAVHGVFAHEVGHCVHTIFDLVEVTAKDLGREMMLLEEIRMEARVIATRGVDRPFLAAASKAILLADPDLPGGRYGACHAATLTLGRQVAGTLTGIALPEIQAHLDGHLDPAERAALVSVWEDAVSLADGDVQGLEDVARRFREIAGDPGDGSSGGLSGALASAADRIAGALASGGDDGAKEHAEALVRAIQARTGASGRGGQGAGGDLAGAPAGTAATGSLRDPWSDERRARRDLARRLRRARVRARTRIERQVADPPGRVHMRALLARDAEQAAGRSSTARPFRRTRRRHAEVPIIDVAIAVDVSGSMGAHAQAMSGALWACAGAVRDVGGRTSAVAFGDAITPLVRAADPLPAVLALSPGGGTAGTFDAVEEALGDLASPHGRARLAVVISDGLWGGSDRSRAVEFPAQMASQGVALVQVGIGSPPATLITDRVCVVDHAGQVGPAIGAQIIAALRAL